MGMMERSREVMAVMDLHEALRNVCINSEWNYAIFWTLRPRLRCRGGVGSKAGEEGSLMLMWEDGYCRPMGCLISVSHMKTSNQVQGVCRATGPSTEDGEIEDPMKRAFKKLSIQLYNYGEGLMGKVASDKCHKWIFRESAESEVGPMNCWQNSFDSHPPEWMDQFSAGIQTIAVIQAGHGLLQLGSCKIVAEDLHFVLRMRYTFEALECNSGSFLSQSFAPMRSRFLESSSGASPSCWPLGYNTLSVLQESDCKFKLGMPNDASNQELLLQSYYDQLPNPTFSAKMGVAPSCTMENTPRHISRNPDSTFDCSQDFGSSKLKRISNSTFTGRQPPPFQRACSSQAADPLKHNSASPEAPTHPTQNIFLDTSSSPSFPSSSFLSPFSNAPSAAMSSLDVYHVQLPQTSERLVENLALTTAPSTVLWSRSMSAPLGQTSHEFEEDPTCLIDNPQSLDMHPKNLSDRIFLDPLHEQISIDQSLNQLSESSLPSATNDFNWTSQAPPHGDVVLQAWDESKVRALDPLEGTCISERKNSACGSGDIYSFMNSLFY